MSGKRNPKSKPAAAAKVRDDIAHAYMTSIGAR